MKDECIEIGIVLAKEAYVAYSRAEYGNLLADYVERGFQSLSDRRFRLMIEAVLEGLEQKGLIKCL